MKNRYFTQSSIILVLFLGIILLKSSFPGLASQNEATTVFLPLLTTPKPITQIVSVSSTGVQTDQGVYFSTISGNGRYIAFDSRATNLVSNDTNDGRDVFVHDIQTRQTTRVSVTSGGAQVMGSSYSPVISTDGRYVVFLSSSPQLVPGDTNFANDVFVHDLQTGETTRVSVASDGTQGNGNSGTETYAEDYMPAISPDGRFVAFTSLANNLVPFDNNNSKDVFVHDRQTGQTTRISIASDGAEANNGSIRPSISNDGHYVSFDSGATNLVSNDNNNQNDIFIHDRQTGTTTRVSIATNGTEGNDVSYNSSISADGRYVTFTSLATTLVPGSSWAGTHNVFLRDRQTNQTTQISLRWDGGPPNYHSNSPVISGDGRFIVFESSENQLIPNNPAQHNSIYVYDHILEKMYIVTKPSANSTSSNPAISTTGQYIVFSSLASNLIPGDVNNDTDIFWTDRIYVGGVP